jgi:hypothetical protein
MKMKCQRGPKPKPTNSPHHGRHGGALKHASYSLDGRHENRIQNSVYGYAVLSIILGIGTFATFIQAFRVTSSGTVILLIDFLFKIRGGSWFRTGSFEYRVVSLV